MQLTHRMTALMMAATLLISGTITACASGGRYYDPYGHDYHQWNRGEERSYRQWESASHRSHVSFGRRNADEQHSYWNWRHR